MLEVSNLNLWRGERHLLKGVALTVAPGQVVQLIWPNGTGKTSLLRYIAGFLHAEEGELRWQGRPVQDNLEEFHWQLAYLGHEPALKGDLSALENLRYACALRRPAPDATLTDTLASVGLSSVEPDQPVRSFSAGQQRRVALARLTLWGAKLWLLDEPAANLDAAGQSVLASVLRKHLQQGGMAVLATHHALELDSAHSRLWTHPAVASI